MSRRRAGRRQLPAEKITFPGVGDRIMALEASVYNATYGWDTCLQDFLTWLFPERVVQTLTDAFPHTYLRSFQQVSCHENVLLSPYGKYGTFVVNGEQARICTPAPGSAYVNRDHPQHAGITRVLSEIAHMHAQFNKVRDVMDWMEQHATPGAARYYCPSMCMLLPTEHPIQQADGIRYKEPTENIAPMIPLIREVAAILTSAKLAEQVPLRVYTCDVAIVSVLIENVDRPNSQPFRLL